MITNALPLRQALLLCAFLFGIFGVSWGQTDRYWSGQSSSSDNIDQGSNWFNGNPNSGDNLYFNNTGNNCGSSGRKWPFSNYGTGSFFNNIIVYNCAGGIRWRGNRTFANKFENFTDASVFEIEGEIANRSNSNFEINPTGSGGINILAASRVTIQDAKILNIYGSYSLNIACTIDQSNGSGSITLNSGHSPTVTLTGECTYTGLTTVSGGVLRLNKSGGGTLPTGNSITVNSGGTLRISSNQTLADLTINSGGTVLIDAGVQLTITGTLTNNGTFTLENGATFKQGASVSGTGTYNVQQALDNCAGSGSTLTGRYWYLGSPVTSLRETSFGNTDALNKVWSFTNGAYTAIADGATLSPTTGYVHRRGSNALPLTFTGTNLYATDETIQLSNNAGTYGGWHLIANPYTAYLDWQQVYNASNALSSAISPSYYIRSFNSTGNDVNALITYNSSTGLESNTSSFSLSSAQAQYIAPMQAFWVKVNPTTPLSATAGQLRLERAFTSHQTGNVGLKNSTIFPTLARVNLVDDARFDQILVFMNQGMSNAVDQYDSEKMFVSGAPQIYTMAAGKKLVMNGLKNNKKKISVPIYLELPQSKVYSLQLADFNLEDGLILLEDKQEGTIQDFTIQYVYSFYANSGVVQNRFILHFFMPDNGITAQGPSNSWVAEEGSYTEGGNVQITADSKGKVQISLDQPETDKVEGRVQVTDANGRIVHSGALEGLTTVFELNVPSGIYYLTVQSGNLIENKKVFIQD